MAMTGNARATAVYNAIVASNPNFAKLSPAEQNALLTSLQTIWGADVIYLTANVDVLPTAHAGLNLNNPVGQSVNIPVTSPAGTPSVGATDALSNISGKGSIA